MNQRGRGRNQSNNSGVCHDIPGAETRATLREWNTGKENKRRGDRRISDLAGCDRRDWGCHRGNQVPPQGVSSPGKKGWFDGRWNIIWLWASLEVSAFPGHWHGVRGQLWGWWRGEKRKCPAMEGRGAEESQWQALRGTGVSIVCPRGWQRLEKDPSEKRSRE